MARHWVKAHEDVDWGRADLFGPVEERTWRSEQPVSLDGLLEMAASRSYVASLEDGPRAELLARIRAEFVDEPEPIVLRYQVDVFVADRA